MESGVWVMRRGLRGGIAYLLRCRVRRGGVVPACLPSYTPFFHLQIFSLRAQAREVRGGPGNARRAELQLLSVDGRGEPGWPLLGLGGAGGQGVVSRAGRREWKHISRPRIDVRHRGGGVGATTSLPRRPCLNPSHSIHPIFIHTQAVLSTITIEYPLHQSHPPWSNSRACRA